MIEWICYIAFFAFGSVLGSFYNVLGLRIPNNESVVFPSSHCPNCGHYLNWYELIPILSFVFLKGKCSNCKKKISWLYPFNEFFCGLLFAISYYSFGLTWELVIALVISSLLILVIASDMTYMIIPDRFTVISSIIIIIVKLFDVGLYETFTSLLSGLLSFGLMFAIMKLGNIMFRKESLGGADIKLMFVVGLVLDPLLALLVIVIASLIALPSSLYIYFKNSEHVIPFGPFIVIGLLIIYFLKINITDLISLI